MKEEQRPREEVQPTPIQPGEFESDPFGCLDRHRSEHWWAPFVQIDLVEVLEYESVRALLGNDRDAVAYDGAFFDSMRRLNPSLSAEHLEVMRERTAGSLINLDGDEHHRLRALVSRAFTPRSVEALAPFVTAEAERLTERMAVGEDFMQTFARPLPAVTLCELIGVPREDHERFIAFIDVLEVQGSPSRLREMTAKESTAVLETQLAFDAYCQGLVDQRRATPRDDLVTRLVREGAAQFNDRVLRGLIGDMIFAGNNPMRNALGIAMITLAAHPATWERMVAEPAYVPAVVEEVLRVQSPAPGPVRRAGTRFDYREHTFEAGAPMALSIWSANRDEKFWGTDAAEFCPARRNGDQHMSFGHGVHFCLGASLAREELRCALTVLSRELTGLELAEEPRMVLPGGIYGPQSVVLNFRRRGGQQSASVDGTSRSRR